MNLSQGFADVITKYHIYILRKFTLNILSFIHLNPGLSDIYPANYPISSDVCQVYLFYLQCSIQLFEYVERTIVRKFAKIGALLPHLQILMNLLATNVRKHLS